MAITVPYIPDFITVHLGEPDEPTQDVTVPFIDYIKNVASSEIYPTWPSPALRANILAEISFALNRIFTEYYRSRDYSFDITASTRYDQLFVYGRNIFTPIAEIVDEIFNNYIRRQGFVEPLFAKYCNGTTTTCDGLSQWGSVDLAENGQNSVSILRYYYGNNIEIVTNAPVMGIMSSLPLRNLRLGTTGNAVETIQLRLNRIGVNYPSIPKIPDVNGYFGIETENAVREFQQIFNLTPDGIVGKATWYTVERTYAGVKQLNDLYSEGLTYDEIPSSYPEVLAIGDNSIGVEYVQYMLSVLSQYENYIPPISVNGNYDTETENAIISFQKAYRLPETGITDEKTYARLFDVYNGIVNSLPDSFFADNARPFPGVVLSIGFSGPLVSSLQTYLSRIADQLTVLPKIDVTGNFGEETRDAVISLQNYAGLPATGRVDIQTWRTIAELYNGIAAGDTVSPEQYPGYTVTS